MRSLGISSNILLVLASEGAQEVKLRTSTFIVSYELSASQEPNLRQERHPELSLLTPSGKANHVQLLD